MTISARRLARYVFVLLLLSACFLDYWGYSDEFHKDPTGNMTIVEGRAEAPQQYRILIVRAAYLLQQHAHLPFRYGFTMFDVISGLVAGFILLHLLERSSAFGTWSETGRSVGYSAFLFLFAYYLIWLVWYQRPETLPTTCFVACMLLLLSLGRRDGRSLLLVGCGSLLLSFLQAFTRADIAACLYGGVFLLALFSHHKLPLPRAYLLALSAAAVAVAAGTQWYIMHRVYPHSTYGSTKVVQLLLNLKEPQRLAAFLLFMAPVFWTYLQLRRRLDTMQPAFLALALGTALFLPLWVILGKVDEVRIFIPFAVTLIPTTVLCLVQTPQGHADFSSR